MIDQLLSNRREFETDPFRRRYRTALFFILFACCAFLRLYDLDRKTMMHDELLFTNYTYSDLYLNWSYRYQAILHGPLMLHIQNLAFHLFGASDYTVRLGASLLGVFGFLWVWKLRYWLGEVGTWTALAFYAIAPGISFFNRFFHQDSLYLFNSLWIIASLGNWWRTRDGRWAASAIIAVTALFNTKASAVFIYFTLLTFLLLFVIYDLVSYFMEGKKPGLAAIRDRIPRFPSGFWVGLTFSLVVILVLTQVFEGLRLALTPAEQKLLGHNWVLKDIRSIPVALGWVTATAKNAPDAGALVHRSFWWMFYGTLIVGSVIAGGMMKVFVDHRIGREELLPRIWQMIYDSRWYLLGGIAFSVFFYLAIYTTFFKHEIGFFDIYRETWAYWGGQHELGRISGPFHQHILNLFIYEMPSFLIIVGAWTMGLFRITWTRTTGFAFLLMILAAGAFQKFLFSGLELQLPGASAPVPAAIPYLKVIFLTGLIAGVATILFPKTGRVLAPAAMGALILGSVFYISGSTWQNAARGLVYKHGEKVVMMERHVSLADYMEIQFNFDGGTSLAIVLVLVFFATIHTWNALQNGRRFEAFAVWWFVTMLGSACYAREAVPQVGIHAMMPAIILASVYIQRFFERSPGLTGRRVACFALGAALLWNAKTAINLDFRNPNDPRERMAYGPSNEDVKAHLNFIRDYVKIASLRVEDGRPVIFTDYNDRKRFKDVNVYIKVLDQVTWPAKWYLRDVSYEEGSDPQKAIDENYEFIFVAVGDEEKYPQLKEKYHLMRGRGTTFWTPNMIAVDSLLGIWKEWIPGHYLDRTPQATDAFNAKADWRRVWRYLLMRETFDGTNRPYPSVSTFEYVFCYRKDLY